VAQERDLRHCGRRRQERHSISTATPSSISTMTPSPMIPSLVRRSMIKSSMEKRARRTQKIKRPGIAPGPSPAIRGPEIRSFGGQGPPKAQVETWPIVLAMRNGEYYLDY
jgi:hypothetical protein